MTPDMFRRLASLGLSHEQMAGVLEIFDEESSERKAKVKARVDKWRAKNKQETLRNVTERSETSQNVSKRLTRAEDSSSNKQITGQEENKDTSPPARSKRGERIPEDFQPDIDAAVSEGLSRPDAERHARSFCDYWRSKPGKDGLKLDWPATWRVWYRRNIPASPKPSATAPPRYRTVAELAIHRLETGQARNEPPDKPDRSLVPSIGSGQAQGPSVLELVAIAANGHRRN